MTHPHAVPPPATDPWLLPEDGIIDPVAVAVAARGQRRVALTGRERLLAAAAILAAGRGAATIAARLHVSYRTADRIRAAAHSLAGGGAGEGAA